MEEHWNKQIFGGDKQNNRGRSPAFFFRFNQIDLS